MKNRVKLALKGYQCHHRPIQPFLFFSHFSQMPRLDGYGATEQIRAAEKISGYHLPIIALTAHAMASDKERCLSCGMDAYLTKPANRVLLVNTVMEFVTRQTG